MLKRFVINAFETRFKKEISKKFAKKGLLIKILNNKQKSSNSLLEILKESDDLNTLRNRSGRITEEEYLSKFRNSSHGGPKHSIAVGRAHHLTNFLSEYIINAFQAGYFPSPEIPDEINTELDLNNYNKEKFSFEISNVELMPDLSALKIFWFSCEHEEVNKKIEDYLEKKIKSQIRTTLTSDRIMNYVPKIVFLRDDSKNIMKQLDNYLLKLNFESKSESNEVEIFSKNTKNNNVNNLYGINVDDIIESIKTDPSREASELNKISSEKMTMFSINQSSNFHTSLKAFEINKRIKQERISKSTLHKLAQLEFEDLKKKN